MDPDPRRYALHAAAQDLQSKRMRREVCHQLAGSFRRGGESLRVAGHLFGPQRVDGTSPFGNGDDHLVGLGYLSETAAALVSGAVELLESSNLYAGAALIRQLVEVEYLTWAFAEDEAEAAEWLRSTRQERRQHWQPRHLRDRSEGRFRGEDYARHCEIGGHPTPLGVRALFSKDAATTTELLLAETASHGASAWEYLLNAIAVLCRAHDFEVTQFVSKVVSDTIQAAEREWRGHERLFVVWQGGRTTDGAQPTLIQER